MMGLLAFAGLRRTVKRTRIVVLKPPKNLVDTCANKSMVEASDDSVVTKENLIVEKVQIKMEAV